MFVFKYGVSTYFCFELIDPSAREVFIGLWFREKSEEASEEWIREHGSNLARLETAPDRLMKN